jgi:hypothetical protein
MTKTVSARINDKVHDEMRDRCNIVGCTVNDFLNGAIELALTGGTEFDFGDRDKEEETPEHDCA